MANKCVYCKSEIPENYALSVCEPCGCKVWGQKMYKAIQENMIAAGETGNLEQGSVC